MSDLIDDEMTGRKSDILDWARYGWPGTFTLAVCMGLLVWSILI